MEDNKDDQSVKYDLLIMLDATRSMSSFLTALHTSLPQIISLSTLTGAFSRVGVLAYRDYDNPSKVIEWSGWSDTNQVANDQNPDLITFAKGIKLQGGGDADEAVKTGLAKAYEVMREDATTIMILYADCPPHLDFKRAGWSGIRSGWGTNWKNEQTALQEKTMYNGQGRHFQDWVSACKMFRDTRKRAHVFPILHGHWIDGPLISPFVFLSTLTGGTCFDLNKQGWDLVNNISSATIEMLLAWMGLEKAGMSDEYKQTTIKAELIRYIQEENLLKVDHEQQKKASPFLSTDYFVDRGANFEKNKQKISLTIGSLPQYLPRRATPITNLTKKWASDAEYRATAVAQLDKIIKRDVRALTLNPVFGSLWRIVCNDRNAEERGPLTTSFGYQVDRMTDAVERDRMRKWLEESYDYTAEVLDLINTIPEAERFPCVCLDPTLSFTLLDSNKNGDQNEEQKAITHFSRDELLEIGRSCDWKILRRLGRVLTRLTYINSASEVPEHLVKAETGTVPMIPMALADEKYGKKFWKVLLHLVVPGTMLGQRAGTLVAALAIRLGLTPLLPAADQTMIAWREKWNDLEVSETWNLNCMSLVLDADRAYRLRQTEAGNESVATEGLMNQDDRELFEALINFRFLELNLETVLTARVGWKPEKTVVPIGPLIFCRSCQFPRSVTVMGPDSICGLCLTQDYASQAQREVQSRAGVTKEDHSDTPATWVECAIQSCRAQYIVYNVKDLNVRAKCHYCRASGSVAGSQTSKNPAPLVECTRCLSCIIWPAEYRKQGFENDSYVCPACTSGHRTVVEVETSARVLSTENGTAWLARDSENPETSPFTGRTLYRVVSAIGTTGFTSRIKLLPETPNTLRLYGKPLHNSAALLSTLQNFISRRKVEQPVCSLCFTNYRYTDLMSACGRHGCKQRVCKDCLGAWYGINRQGQIINTAALSCPFCRRLPSGRILNKYSIGIRAVPNLIKAVEEQGQWIYAWCNDCGSAKQYMERVCARGAPDPVTNWSCEECQDARTNLANRAAAKSKPCPKCAVMTQKTAGCDHITCPVKDCNTHWCYSCGKEFSYNDMYRHMNEAHGGLYAGGGDDEFAYDDDTDYEDEEEEEDGR